MSDVHLFRDKDNRFQLSVKSEFLKECPNPETYTIYELHTKFYLIKYLHNEQVPAVVRQKDGKEQFWMNGRCVDIDSPEDAKRMRHNYQFNNKLQEAIEE
jgi:hypothetical protein